MANERAALATIFLTLMVISVMDWISPFEGSRPQKRHYKKILIKDNWLPKGRREQLKKSPYH